MRHLAALFALLPWPVLAQDWNAAPPNAPYVAAFPGQTRAPALPDAALALTPLAEGLRHPWGMEELPDGRWLVTERPGRMRIVSDRGVSKPIQGLPPVHAEGQGGLLDVVIARDFDKTRRVWWSYAEPRGALNGTAVATGVLSADETRLDQVTVIFRQAPGWASDAHYGGRLVLAPDGALILTTGERSDRRARLQAQDPASHLGKVIRLSPGGGPAPGNPALPGWAPEVWSIGHRNVQSAAYGPDGRLYTIEHGPLGGDELNRPEAGRNYGWPVVTYGLEYSGAAIGQGLTEAQGMEQPLYYWDPVIAPSGLAFYDGAMFPDWRGSLLVGALGGQALVRLTLKGDRITGEARYLQGMARIRDVAVARDGAIMILTDEENGALIRLTPKP
ncbi:PQQ-dependent sugar dehydrogenase [Stagnihabitans tardus]|uniref:PQQ-dependent sugar dehydrogenase n=1 Tax=Stagnihabitans tardus TaxID=2699202 RepID=A0AAE4YBR4_9RHOB|nr:PQQ-dependent sugar dehydrogenase [Stagnihabitans tardus]NBZ89757.1 PQQ-dependent sugar dehydrogenase [Stagnihabitans tardus]